MQNFELHRVQTKLQDFEDEHKQLSHQILKVRQNEQFELDMLRRRFDGLIRRLEGRRMQIEKEQKNYRRQLERIEKQMEDELEAVKEESEREELAKRTGRRF